MRPSESEPPTPERPAPASFGLGALVIALFALAFLARPIARFGDGYFAPADIAQSYTLTKSVDGYQPGNSNLSDVFVQMHPWMMFNKHELAQGRLPVWNPWNGGGMPHLANYQSSVLSPFSVPYYVLPFKLAILVAAFLKLFALGLGTFLFLRELRLSFAAACFGAVSYMFAAHNVILLGFPHSGVAAIVPWSLFVFERAVTRAQTAIDRGERARWWRVPFPGVYAGMAAVLALGVLAGHPETLYFGVLGLFVYAVWRSIGLLRANRGARGTVAIWLVQLALVGVLAAGIGAIQLVPFFEYLRNSRMIDYRSSGPQTPLEIDNWPLQVFPDLLGMPGQRYFLGDEIPTPNFTTTTMSYVGGVTFFLALVSLLFVRRSRVHRFFVVFCIVWIFYAFDIWGSSTLLQKIPSIGVAPINRSQPLWVMALSTCAAFALHHLLTDRRRLATAIGLVAGGLVFVFFFRTGAARLVEIVSRSLPEWIEPMRIPMGAPVRMEGGTAVVLSAVAVLAALAILRKGRARSLAAVGIVLVGAVQSGGVFFTYNPITPDELFYKPGQNMAKLRARVGDDEFLVMGTDVIPPPSNIAYGVRQITYYDALGISRYEQLYRRILDETNNWCEVLKASVKGLQLFGVSWVLSPDRWLEIDEPMSGLEVSHATAFESPELIADRDITQDFAAYANGLDAIRIPFLTRGKKQEFSLDVSIEDGETNEVLRTKHFGPGAVPIDPGAITRWIFFFEPIADSAQRHLRLRLHSADSEIGHTWTVQCNSDMRWWINVATWRQFGEHEPPDGKFHESVRHWKARAGDVDIDGNLFVDFSHSWSAFKPVGRVGHLIVYRFERGCGRFHTVGRAIASSGKDESWTEIVDGKLDPREVVVLEGVDAASLPEGRSEDAPVEILEESPGHFRLRARRETPGWLVMAQGWYPGWDARVNGAPAEILRANYAFRAVALPSGASEVELDYRPMSVRIGIWTTFASLVAVALWLTVSARARPLL